MGLDGVQVGWGEFICVARVLKKIYGKCLCFENRRQKLTSVGLAFLTDYHAIVFSYAPATETKKYHMQTFIEDFVASKN